MAAPIKLMCAAFVVAAANAGTRGKLQCNIQDPSITVDWIHTSRGCAVGATRQVDMVLKASLQYLAMAAHFSNDRVNRPGFAELFYQSASEQREHAIALMDYLAMRGLLSDDTIVTYEEEAPKKTLWVSAVEAVENALQLETTVTRSTHDLIKQCEHDHERSSDYHIVDYLTGELLTEQHHRQRELAGHAATLKKMVAAQGNVGEFLYDKQLLASH